MTRVFETAVIVVIKLTAIATFALYAMLITGNGPRIADYLLFIISVVAFAALMFPRGLGTWLGKVRNGYVAATGVTPENFTPGRAEEE